MKNRTSKSNTSSFRDPDGFIFSKNNTLYRQINKICKDRYDLLISSGLYKELTKRKLLVPHEEIPIKFALTKEAYKVIKPEIIPFISYPYEWSFSQLKDAALLTLEIQQTTLNFGMTLKDASAFNVQFIGSKPIFIDTLSFEKYTEGKPWVAYRQFCQHFLSPLALMSITDLRLNLLSKEFIDGIPLDLTSKLLPAKSRLNLSLLTHLHLHALNQKRMANKKVEIKNLKMNKFQMISLISNLISTTKKLEIKKQQTEWGKYYTFTNYSTKAFKEKKFILNNFLKKIKPKSVIDLGANTGEFSKIAVKNGAYTIACDIDPLAVNKAYLNFKGEKLLQPMIIDLTNPSPAIGWGNQERKSFSDRVDVDCVIAFALIHHLAISNNLPFPLIAEYFSSLGKYLIIEFVPKDDSKVIKLLQNREDIFPNYTKERFEKDFKKFYKILDVKKIKESKRAIYLLEKR